MAKRIEIQLYNTRTGESLTLPLNPESTDLENAKDIKTYNILGFGEVSIKGNKLLQRLTLSNILPDDNTFFAQLATFLKGLNLKTYNLKETIDMINRWVDNDEIIRVIISDRLNKEFRIASYVDQVKESVRDSGYTIELIEYRNPSGEFNKEQPQGSNITKLKQRAINKFIPNQKILSKGMTAYKLCTLTYGGKFDKFANLNNIADKNKDLTGEIVEMLPL